jgi:hypothetical protein
MPDRVMQSISPADCAAAWEKHRRYNITLWIAQLFAIPFAYYLFRIFHQMHLSRPDYLVALALYVIPLVLLDRTVLGFPCPKCGLLFYSSGLIGFSPAVHIWKRLFIQKCANCGLAKWQFDDVSVPTNSVPVEASVPTNSVPVNEADYKTGFDDFQRLMADPSVLHSIAPMLEKRLRYRVVGKGSMTEVRTPSGATVDLHVLYAIIQSDSQMQSTLQQRAIALDFEMTRRGPSYEEAQARKKQAAQEIEELRRHHPPRKISEYSGERTYQGWRSLRLGVLVLGILATPFLRFTSSLAKQADRDQALQLATNLHHRMLEGDIDGIYNDADPGLKAKVDLSHHRALFSNIARKLGSPMDCQQGVTAVKYGLFTKKIRSECRTRFSNNSTRVETLIWASSGDQYRLYYYFIRSDDNMNR